MRVAVAVAVAILEAVAVRVTAPVLETVADAEDELDPVPVALLVPVAVDVCDAADAVALLVGDTDVPKVAVSVREGTDVQVDDPVEDELSVELRDSVRVAVAVAVATLEAVAVRVTAPVLETVADADDELEPDAVRVFVRENDAPEAAAVSVDTLEAVPVRVVAREDHAVNVIVAVADVAGVAFPVEVDGDCVTLLVPVVTGVTSVDVTLLVRDADEVAVAVRV